MKESAQIVPKLLRLEIAVKTLLKGVLLVIKGISPAHNAPRDYLNEIVCQRLLLGLSKIVIGEGKPYIFRCNKP